MASAEDYARWIIANQAKKGTPEFETVSKAYQAAKTEPGLSSGGPFDALSDAAYKAGDWINEQANKVLPAPVAAGIGTAGNLGVQALPMLAGGGLGAKLQGGLEGLGRWLMGKALNPSTSEAASGKGARAIATMLREGIPVGANAVTEAKGTLLPALNAQVDATVAASPKALDMREITPVLADVMRKFENRPNAAAIPEELAAKAAQFENHPLIQGAERYAEHEIPVQEAHRLKQGYQAAVGDKGYGELKTVDTEADKALARRLRMLIGEAEPSVTPTLAREAELINALKIAGRRAFRQTGVNPLPLGASIAAIAHEPTTAIGMFANASPYIQSQLARLIYSGIAPQMRGIGALTGAGIGAASGTPDKDY